MARSNVMGDYFAIAEESKNTDDWQLFFEVSNLFPSEIHALVVVFRQVGLKDNLELYFILFP